jgi:hypothetical protein
MTLTHRILMRQRGKPRVAKSPESQIRTKGHQAPRRRNGGAVPRSVKAILQPDKSAELRNQLLAEVEGLASAEAVTTWAHRTLGAKNSLTETDARSVEEAFQTKLATFAVPQEPDLLEERP